MKQDNLNALKALNTFANSTGLFWENYDKTTAPGKCDKHGALFQGDNRFTLFAVTYKIRFDAHTGYYGSSSCSTFGGLFEEALIDTYFKQALNVHKRAIFKTMSDLAKQDAARISDAAQDELVELQKLVSAANQNAINA